MKIQAISGSFFQIACARSISLSWVLSFPFLYGFCFPLLICGAESVCGEGKIYSCKHCGTHLALTDYILSKMQLKPLQEEMQAISKSLDKVNQELVASESDGPVSEVFHQTLKNFVGEGQSEVSSVKNLHATAAELEKKKAQKEAEMENAKGSTSKKKEAKD